MEPAQIEKLKPFAVGLHALLDFFLFILMFLMLVVTVPIYLLGCFILWRDNDTGTNSTGGTKVP